MKRRTEIGVGRALLTMGAGVVAGAQSALYLYDRYDDGVAEPLSGFLGLLFIVVAVGIALWPFLGRGSQEGQTG